MRTLIKVSIPFIGLFMCWGLAVGQCNELEVINQKKTAIIFGQKDYQFAGALTNPLHDANDISDSLKKVGFVVYTYYNTDYKTMVNVLDDWYTKISKFDVALLYYSGHGAEMNGENWLFPIDANPKSQSDVLYQAYSANRLLDKMEENNSKCNIMILDACRTNPFTRNWNRDIQAGLASMSGKGSFIGFAASPGQTAEDGKNRNGTYTEGILQFITIPNLSIDQIFTKVNAYVRSKSELQRPYKNSSLSVDFCFSIKSNKTPNGITKSTFIQPASRILLNPKGEKLYMSDGSGSGLLVKDAKILIDIETLQPGKIKPYKLTSRNGNNIYVIDTVEKTLSIFSSENAALESKTVFDFTPLSIATSIDEKKAYITGLYKNGKGSVFIFDAVQRKVIKEITLDEPCEAIVTSPNGKYAYTISKTDTGNHLLVVIETKSDRIINKIERIACGEAICILPNGKKMYVSNHTSIVNEVNIIDLPNLKTSETLVLSAKAFATTLDSKFIIALGETNVAIIQTDSSVVLTRMPFATTTSAITISDDYKGFVWLPMENRTFVFNLLEAIKIDTTVDYESKLTKFKNELNKFSDVKEKERNYEIILQADQVLSSTVSQLAQEIGPAYEGFISTHRNYYNDGFCELEYGIQLKTDNSKQILFSFKTTVKNNDFTTLIKYKELEQSFRSKRALIDWDALRKIIRKLVISNIDRLKPSA